MSRKQLNKLIEDYKNGNINYIDKVKRKFIVDLYLVIGEFKKVD